MTYRSTLTQVGNTVDVSELKAFANQFRTAARQFYVPIISVQPEFGAYMSYSLFQEVGTANNKPPPRPHIIPALLACKSQITNGMANYLNAYLHATVGKKRTIANLTKIYEEAWMRVLNGPARIKAVSLAQAQGVWEYGFHARSIHGYATPRSQGEILAMQREAAEQRKKLPPKKRKK